MAEITVTVLDINKIKSRLLCVDSSLHKIRNEFADVVISHQGMIGRHIEFAIEQRVAIEGLRFKAFFIVWAGKAAAVRNLQPDKQIIGGVKTRTMTLNQHRTQARHIFNGIRRDHELLWVGASIMAHGS